MKENEIIEIDSSSSAEVEIVEEVPSDVATIPSGVSSHPEDKHLDGDFATARKNLMALVEDGDDALKGVLSLALASDSPRAYEVVGQLLKIVSETNSNLLALQDQMADIRRKSGENSVRAAGGPLAGDTNIKNAIFVGSTMELQRMLVKVRKDLPTGEKEVMEAEKAKNE